MKLTRQAANRLRQHGRYGDDQLLHVSTGELQGLAGLAAMAGRPITTNPATGLPEAFSLGDILPWVLGAAAIALSAGALAPEVGAAAAGAEGAAAAGGAAAATAPTLLGTAGADALAGSAAADTLATAAPTVLTAGNLAAPAALPLQLGSTADAISAFTGAGDFASIAGGTPEALAGGLTGGGSGVGVFEPSTFLGDVAGYGKDALQFAKENPLVTGIGLNAIGNWFTPKPKGQDKYDPDAHPTKSLPQSEYRINRYVGTPVGFRPGIDSHNYFPGYRYAEGGQVQNQSNNSLSNSILDNPFQFGLISLIPGLLDKLTSTSPGAIDRNQSMGPTNEDRRVRFGGGGLIAARQAEQRRMNSIPTQTGLTSTGAYGYSNTSGTPSTIFDRIAGRVPDVTTQAPQTPRVITQNPIDLSAFVPNIPGIERVAFTPQQTPNWRASLPFNYAQGDQRPPLKIQGYAQGGEIDQNSSDQIVAAAVEAIRNGGKDPESQAALQQFVQVFGPDALKTLVARVAQAGQGRTVPGDGAGMEDDVPAVIDGQQPAALSSGEFVVPADVVTHMGPKNLHKMVDNVRMKATGTAKQPKPVNPEDVIPI